MSIIYNNGSTISFNQIEDYSIAAKEFAEGDKELEKLLLYCFSNGIMTVACCKGHKENGTLPYIAFVYNEKNKKIIYYLMSLLNNYDISILFTKSIGGYIFSIHSVKDDFELFKIINNALKSEYKETNITDDFKSYINIMNDSYGNNILNDQNFCIKYAKQEDMCGYRFSLFGLENCEIFEEAGFKKYNSPYAVYFINSLDRGILSNKLDTIKNSLEQTNTKR